MMQKLHYFFRSLRNQGQAEICPNCGQDVYAIVDRKYLVTKLLKCLNCRLSFRYPRDTKEFLNDFYQSEYKANYSKETLNITDLPADGDLIKLMETNFPNKRNHAPCIHALLKTYSARVLDYGCSWGYSEHHLKMAGYDAEGFEISRSRAEFGKKINVPIHYLHKTVRNDLDLIISSHTIKYLPVISEFIRFSSEKLKTDGIFMAFCPNGSPEYRNCEPDIFHVNWGFLHPNYLDIEFAVETFKRNPYLILTGDLSYDVDTLFDWNDYSNSSVRSVRVKNF